MPSPSEWVNLSESRSSFNHHLDFWILMPQIGIRYETFDHSYQTLIYHLDEKWEERPLRRRNGDGGNGSYPLTGPRCNWIFDSTDFYWTQLDTGRKSRLAASSHCDSEFSIGCRAFTHQLEGYSVVCSSQCSRMSNVEVTHGPSNCSNHFGLQNDRLIDVTKAFRLQPSNVIFTISDLFSRFFCLC